MHLARVLGTVVATEIVPDLVGTRLLILQPLSRQLEPEGGVVVAADAVCMAGFGELVYFVASREAALTLAETFVPVDHAIVGIADDVGEVSP